MNPHSQHYLDLNPEPVEREPHPVIIWAGAALALIAFWVITVFLFSL